MDKIKKLFLEDHIILWLIAANALLIFIAESIPGIDWMDYLENLFTIVFIIEAIVKIRHWGLKRYFSDGWNRFDFIVVLLSLPSLGTLFFASHLIQGNIFLSLRIFRVFKTFRLFKFLPDADNFVVSIKRALKASYIVLLGFFIMIFIVSIISTSMYKNIAPEYFDNPITSFYTIFQVFSVEGWYEIPNFIAERSSGTIAFLTKFYFSVLLFVGGIIGFSLVNSIFVDAMVSDNNDDLEEEVIELRQQIELLNRKMDILINDKNLGNEYQE